MNNIIKNPSADQLEAGGKVSGTYRDLPFSGQELKAGHAHSYDLYIGDHVWVRLGLGSSMVTVTEYEPPEPPPVWQTVKDDEWLAYSFKCKPDEVIAVQAGHFRRVFVADSTTHLLADVHRVVLCDPDTQVIVPKAALDKLRESWQQSTYFWTSKDGVRRFLNAVYEANQ